MQRASNALAWLLVWTILIAKGRGMKRTVLVLLLVLTLSITSSSAVFGQATASGAIQGTVLDKSEAVVVGAEVFVTSKATGTTRTVATSDTGSFRFDLLSAGLYTVRVSKAGFSTVTQNVELLVGQTATANVVLNPGSISETIEVTSEA